MNYRRLFSYLVFCGLAFCLGWVFMFGFFHGGKILARELNLDLPLKQLANVSSVIDPTLFSLETEESDPDFDTLAVYIKETVAETDFSNDSADNVLMFVGDIMLDRAVRESVEKNASGDYAYLFSELAELQSPNILFGNLEGPVSSLGQNQGSLYSFRMAPEVIRALKNAGFDVLSIANNHIGDWGRDAFIDTISRLDYAGIKHPGGGANLTEAQKPAIIESQGVTFGFLGFSDVGPNYLKAQPNQAGILLASDPKLDLIIKEASAMVDVLVVSFHFGDEYENKANLRQQTLAKKAIDSGAKIVVGHHPHVVQPIEEYGNGLIVYSLGNFIFDQSFSDATMSGLVLSVKMKGKQIESWGTKTVKLDNQFKPIGLSPNLR